MSIYTYSKLLICIFVCFLSSYCIFGEKRALIIGVTGQDGNYLAHFLAAQGYSIYGITRSLPDKYQAADFNLPDAIHLFAVDAAQEADKLQNLITCIQPDEIYYLAAQSSPALSFKKPKYSFINNTSSALTILEIIRSLKSKKKIKLFLASSSEIIQKNNMKDAENEDFLLHAVSPYGLSKLVIYKLGKIYRKAYGLFICTGILFNHESPIRPERFLVRKISKGVAEIAAHKRQVIEMGNLDAQRDIGFAGDYIEAMWLMLQQQNADDFIIATGELYTVRQIIELAFGCIGRKIVWRGRGVNEEGIDAATNKTLVKVSSQFFRPLETPPIKGNASKASKCLHWQPKMTGKQLIKLMVEHDQKLLSKKSS